MPIPLAAAIPIATTALSAAGQVGSAAMSGKMNKKSREFAREQAQISYERGIENFNRETAYNTEMWNKQNAYNQQMWHMQNEYDSPAAQMQRFRDAGLNPNLIYGSMSGGSAPMEAASVPAGQVSAGPKAEWHPNQLPGIDLGGALMQMLDAKSRMAQTNNLEKQNELLEAEKGIKAAQKSGLDIDNMQKLFNYNFASEMRGVSADYKRAMLSNLVSQVDMRYNNYNLAVQNYGLKEKSIDQQIKESNQRIDESIARTGATRQGMGLTYQKIMNESARRPGIYLDNLNEETRNGLIRAQEEATRQGIDLRTNEMYMKFMQMVLSAAGLRK